MEIQTSQYRQEDEHPLVEFEQRYVGSSVKRLDGFPKVTGKIVYTRDMVLPFMLYGKIKRSPYAHAKILSIDFAKALEIPGVKAVVTGRDFPSLATEETPALATDVALYSGQAVAAVAAETKELAEEALNAIEIKYEELPTLTDPLVAMSDNPPSVISHDGVKTRRERPNVGKHVHAEKGNVDLAFKEESNFIF